MRSLLFALLLLCGTAGCDTTTVYVCDSPHATRYHYNEHCRGLSNCDFRIVKTTLDSARAKHLTLCKWERQPPDTL